MKLLRGGKMRKSIFALLSIFIVFTLLLTIPVSVSAASCGHKHFSIGEIPDKTLSNITFGVCVHDPSKPAYSAEDLEEYMHLIAKMGCKIVRVDLSTENLDWLDSFVSLANAYGIKVTGVTYSAAVLRRDYTTDAEYNDAIDAMKIKINMLATRYNGKNGRGKIDYFQIGNEEETAPQNAAQGNGIDPDSFFIVSPPESKEELPNLTEYLNFYKVATETVRNADTDAKITLNFGYKFCGALRWYQEQGIDFDAVNWNWYVSYGEDIHRNPEKTSEFADDLHSYFPDKEIIVSESNIDQSSVYSNVQNGTLSRKDPCLWDNYLSILEVLSNKPYISTIIAYELLDQFNINGKEGTFGLVANSKTGGIGEPWPIYYDLQARIGGNPNTAKLLVKDLDLSPYDALQVGTADDSDVVIDTDNNDIESDFVAPVLPDNFFEQDINEGSESDVEEEFITDNLINDDSEKQNIKVLTTTNTSYKTPWLIVGLSVGGLVLLAVCGVLFVIFKSQIMTFLASIFKGKPKTN